MSRSTPLLGLLVYCSQLIACSLLVASATASALAHPVHTSLAEADYNHTTKKLEVALRVFADDFEAALSARAKTRITLGKTPRADFDTHARAYLAERFILKSPDGQPATLAYLGRDYKDAANELWLFFEFSLPSGPENALLHHAVLTEEFSDQLNTVQLRDADRRTTLVFLPREKEKRLRFHL
jgi:hypothetical protein